MMKRLARLSVLLSCACIGVPALAAEAPQHVMSINLCTDKLVLDLLPPERIASVSWLASKGYGSTLAEKASHVALNHGSPEEVLAERPDLVVAGLFTSATTKRLLKRAGIPLVELSPAEDFDAIRETTRQLGRALHVEDRAEALLRDMDTTLAALAATAPEQRIRVAGWDGGGAVPGTKTLFNAILNAAGAENIAAAAGEGYVKFDFEQLLVTRPDLLAYGDTYTSTPALRSQSLQHPLIRTRYAGRQFVYPQIFYECGSPASADGAKQLREAMTRLLANAPPPK